MAIPPVQWAASMVGISTDCADGLHHLEIAVSSSKYSWIEASNVLSYAYLHIERDFEKAKLVINPLVETFPGHPYFAFLKGELLAKTKNWDELSLLMPILEKFSIMGPFIQQNECQLKLAYIKGLKAYHRKDFISAIKQCSWINDIYHMEFDWLKGFSQLLRAESYFASGKLDLALSDYNRVLDMDSYYPEKKEASNRIREINQN